jgi:Flp pilus assembly protein TadG
MPFAVNLRQRLYPPMVPTMSHVALTRAGRTLARRINKPRPRKRWFASERGNALVETAVTMPLIMLIMVGIFTFCIALFQKFELSEAVCVGGTFLSVDRGDTDPCASATTKLLAAAPGLSSSKVSLTYTLNGVATTGTSCPGSSGAANANMVSGGSAQVTASYPCVLTIFPAYKSTTSSLSCTLHATIVEVVQ